MPRRYLSSSEPNPRRLRPEPSFSWSSQIFSSLDQRYREAAIAYERAKEGARTDQVKRASGGSLRSLLFIAEFNLVSREVLFLQSLGLGKDDADLLTLVGDGLWASGLFEEAESAYLDGLAASPKHSRARHGLARSLSAKSLYDQAFTRNPSRSGDQPTGCTAPLYDRHDPSWDASIRRGRRRVRSLR